MPLSGKEMRKLFLEVGYEIDPGGGKGSHWKLKKARCPTAIIPNPKTRDRTLSEKALEGSWRKNKMKYHFRIQKEKKGYSAQCIELEGCITQGDTLKELQKNMKEALNLYVQEPADSEDLAALPKESIRKSKAIVGVALDPSIAFSFLVRYYRLAYGMTQQEVAKAMGFDNVYSYQRLERRKCNPTLKIMAMVKQIFPEFSLDYALGC
ncbi:MAG: hypothetical protein K940chlam2_00359 [Chlamydiae bacterium]|nr:hypothetical protein [Chlamydiota bacterium]